MMNMLKQQLVGKRVKGSFAGFAYTGTIIETQESNGHFNHVIKLDDGMILTMRQLDYPQRYWGYKPQLFQGLNYCTENAERVAGTPDETRMTMNLL